MFDEAYENGNPNELSEEMSQLLYQARIVATDADEALKNAKSRTDVNQAVVSKLIELKKM